MMLLAVIDNFDSAIRAWGDNLSWPAEQLFRLIVAAVAGGLVGLEREVRGRQAGFRTNMLVCVGCALVMIVSISFAGRSWPHEPHVNMNIDPARIAYGIMTGIGFLGAGTIIKHDASVRGLTTAAAMWCVAAIGMAAGFGMYSMTVVATILVLLALWFLDYVSNFLPKTHHRVIVVRRRWRAGIVAETIERAKQAGMSVIDSEFQRTPDLAFADIQLHVAFFDRQTYYLLEQQLERDPDYELLATRGE